MSFMEKLRVLIDVDSKGATTGIGGFRNAVRDADGFTGKFKAGANSAMQSVKANAAALAVTGGAALVAFGAKALAAFEDSAKAAIDFGKATGLSTEAASRWIAVADDYSVSADALQAAIGRASKKGLDFVDVMVQINEAAPGERARVGAELLGKSWQSVAPLLGKTRAEYEAMLAAVGEGQVITEKEAAKAEKMRLAQDRLSDAIERVTMAFGEFVAENADTVDSIASTVEVVTDLNERLGDYVALAQDITNPFAALNIEEDLLALEGGVIKSTVAVDAFGDAADDARPSVEELIDAFSEAHDAAGDVKDLADEFAGLLGQLDTADAVDAVAEAFDDVATAAQEAFDASEQGSADAEQKARDQAAAVRDLERDVIDFGDSVSGLPKERITEILTKIHEGDFAEAERMFAVLVADATKEITVKTKFDNGPLGEKGVGADGSLNPAVMTGPAGVGTYQPPTNLTVQVVIDGKVISAISKKIQGNLKGER